jgi:hypothetical protein
LLVLACSAASRVQTKRRWDAMSGKIRSGGQKPQRWEGAARGITKQGDAICRSCWWSERWRSFDTPNSMELAGHGLCDCLQGEAFVELPLVAPSSRQPLVCEWQELSSEPLRCVDVVAYGPKLAMLAASASAPSDEERHRAIAIAVVWTTRITVISPVIEWPGRSFVFSSVLVAT